MAARPEPPPSRSLPGRLALAATLVALLPACTGGAGPAPLVWPGDEWARSAPEAQGMDSATMLRLFDRVEAEDLPIHGLFVARNGVVVLDASFFPDDGTAAHDVASCTKSVVAAVYGAALHRGLVPGPDTRVLDALGMPDRPDDVAWATMTIDDLLTMRSGLDWKEDRDLWAMRASDDWGSYVMSVRGRSRPGEEFVYSSGVSHLLGIIVERSAGRRLEELAEDLLFGPIGVGAVAWPSAPEGVPYGAGDLKMRRSDLARIGLLFLADGMWRDRRILPPGWVDETGRGHVDLPDDDPRVDAGYGWHWWTYGAGVFAAQGRGQQYLLVDRGRGLVVVANGGATEAQGDTFAALWFENIVGAAVRSRPLRDSPRAASELARRAESAGRRPARTADDGPATPEWAVTLDGVRFVLDPNDLELVAVSLGTGAAGPTLVLEWPEGALPVRLGTGGVPAMTVDGPAGLPVELPVAAAVTWSDEPAAVIDLDLVRDIDRWTLTIAFDQDRVSVAAEEHTTGRRPVALFGRAVRPPDPE